MLEEWKNTLLVPIHKKATPGYAKITGEYLYYVFLIRY